ncbi:MAG: NFACT RNA binding domain-containing protein [Spirochaeta sp.]|nr:NFACT RNA binding domain-containing protein [Spirochaeta sp.]
MSLNWREIHSVLEELHLNGSYIQRIVQPDFSRLVLELYRPGKAFQVVVVLRPGVVRMHRIQNAIKKPKTQQRFASLLASRLKGARIVSAYQYDRERIVRLAFTRADERGLLWIRLWSGAANVVLTTENNIIIDAYFRRPKRNEISGGQFELPAPSLAVLSERFAKTEAFRRRSLDASGAATADGAGGDGGAGGDDGADRGDAGNTSENRFLEAWYAELDSAPLKEGADATRAGAERRLEELQTELIRRRNKAEERLNSTADYTQLTRQADTIMGNQHLVQTGAAELVTEDNQGNALRIPLDPHLPPYATAEKLYERAKRLRATAEHAGKELAIVSKEEERLRAYAVELTQGNVPSELQTNTKSEQRSGSATEDQRPGLRFFSGDFVILVGRNARENDGLLRRYVRGNDTWLHARDYPGGYVFIKQQPGKSVPLEVLIDAGNLAVHYSKARGEQTVELYYTQVKHLRRAKHGALGLVIPTQEKNLRVRFDSERLQKLLSSTR